MFLKLLILLQVSCGQVETTAGVLSADHCDRTPFVLSLPASDVRITSRRIGKNAVKLSKRQPVFFRCRRGTTYKLKVVSKYRHRVFVDRIFYNGESGLPVFDKNGDCCGLIVGNTFLNRRWVGRVATFDELSSFVDERAFRPESFETPKSLRQEPDADSILESENR